VKRVARRYVSDGGTPSGEEVMEVREVREVREVMTVRGET